MDIQLLVRVDNKPEKKVTVSKDVIIGRSKTCQFRVLSNDVSREHCKLLVSEEVVAIRDLGSSNGTLVNGKAIPTGIDVLLHPGSNVEVGPLKFIVQFEAKHKIAPPPEPVAEKPAASSATPTKTAKPKAAAAPEKPAAAVPAKTKTAAKSPTANGAASAKTPTAAKAGAVAPAKKKVAKKPAPAAEETGFPFAASSGESDEGPAWPDFLLGGEQASEGPSAEGPTIANPVAEAAAVPETDEFSFGGPPEADSDEPIFDFGGDDEPTVMPGVTTPTSEAAESEPPVVEALDEPAYTEPPKPVAAEVAETLAPVAAQPESDDEPVFGEFAGGDDDSEFAFDPEAAAAAAPVASPTAPTPAAKPAAQQQPGKLKSLFGLFGKGKAAAPAPTPAAPAKPAAAPAPAATPAAPATAAAAAGDDDGLNDFLTGSAPAGGGDDDDTPDWMKQLS